MQSEIITALIDHIKNECKPIDQEAAYDDVLDECYSFKSVGGIFASMSPSRVLREVDPVAYRCGMNDYFGTSDHYEIDGDVYDNSAVDDAREEFESEMESAISDLEAEIEEAENDEDFDLSKLAEMKRKLDEKQADLKEVKDYTL